MSELSDWLTWALYQIAYNKRVAPGRRLSDAEARRIFAISGSGPLVPLVPHARRKPSVPITHRVFLSIADAVDYSGLSAKLLRRMIAEGKLPADTEGHMRVRRADLDKL